VGPVGPVLPTGPDGGDAGPIVLPIGICVSGGTLNDKNKESFLQTSNKISLTITILIIKYPIIFELGSVTKTVPPTTAQLLLSTSKVTYSPTLGIGFSL
jgi:hypothetical protein